MINAINQALLLKLRKYQYQEIVMISLFRSTNTAIETA
ncbi:hypothetical protein NSP_12220 [Nodularia spumigena CCY9414]|nr:hypothetical protein NSP_12220 [Nodularia spumigena CCY9414]